ncbi:MAG: LysR family transcriptional regulator [Clostridiales bacterium]|nr:LysR family transcriptional regulator [Clostridiales bacterium]
MNDLGIICFLSIARTLNFSITAKELSITQQAVSRHVQKLEDELGFPLFLRHYHSIRLTKAGENYYRLFSEFESKLVTVFNMYRNRFDSGNPVLRIGWTDWLGYPKWLCDSFSSFKTDYAGLELSVCQGSAHKMKELLVNGEVDLAVMTGCSAANISLPVSINADESINSAFKIETLQEIPLYLIIAANHPLAQNKSVPEILPALPHIAADAGEASNESILRRVRHDYAKLGLIPGEITIASNTGSAYVNVLLGNGISFSAGNDFAQTEGKLLYLPLESTVTIAAVSRAENTNPYTGLFIKQIRGFGGNSHE